MMWLGVAVVAVAAVLAVWFLVGVIRERRRVGRIERTMGGRRRFQ